MSILEMQHGYYRMLKQLFSPGAMYQRSGALLERLEPHIFHGRNIRRADFRAALRSLWRQGIVRAPRGAYFRLLWKGWLRDRARLREATRAAARVQRQLRRLAAPRPVAASDAASLLPLLERAREALLRAEPERRIEDVAAWAASVKERIAAGTPTIDDLRALYRGSHEYFVRQRRLHRFPGAYLVKAFNLAIKGLHYEIVMDGIVPQKH